MRKIKFRGHVPDSDCIKYQRGMVVYGSLTVFDKPFQGYTHWIVDTEAFSNYPVEPDSVAQLIGTDKKGNEVYEGDEIVSRFGNRCFAWFDHYAGIRDGAYTLSETRLF